MLVQLKMVYGEHAMKKLHVFEQHRKFKKGQDVYNDAGIG